MKCIYCHEEDTSKKLYPEGKCPHCGAPWENSIPKWQRMDPYYYNGYIVWVLKNEETQILEFQFWKGDILKGSVRISHEELIRMPDYFGVDITPLMYNRWQQYIADEEGRSSYRYSPADGCGLA